MRISLTVGNLLGCLLLTACASTPPDMPQPISMVSEHTETSKNTAASYPMLYAPPETATPIPICERFLSSMSAAENKMNLATHTNGYQMTSLYTP